MCDPASAALAAAQLYKGYQQDQRARALNRYQEVLHDANVKNAKQAEIEEFQALDRRQQEERRRAAESSARIARQARLAAGAALARSESTAGGAVEAVVSDFERQSAEQQSSLDFNLHAVEAQLQGERKAASARFAERVASTIPNPIPGADWANIAIGTTAQIAQIQLDKP